MLLAGCLHTIISYKLLNKGTYPFSQSFELAQDMNTGMNILLTLLAGLFALIHFIALSFSNGIYIYLGVLLIVTIVSWFVAFPKNSAYQLQNQA